MDTTLDTDTEEPKKAITPQSKDVLRENMLFYHFKSKDILAQIIAGLKLANVAPQLLGEMYKRFAESSDMAIKCAKELAPYEHPKLQNIEMKGELTKRYVIRAPEQAKNSSEWLKTINPAENAQIMAPIKQDIIEDIKFEG